jgi:hypothetical protein
MGRERNRDTGQFEGHGKEGAGRLPLNDSTPQSPILFQPQCGFGFNAAVERAPEKTSGLPKGRNCERASHRSPAAATRCRSDGRCKLVFQGSNLQACRHQQRHKESEEPSTRLDIFQPTFFRSAERRSMQSASSDCTRIVGYEGHVKHYKHAAPYIASL